MLRAEDINFESALNLWGNLQANIDILKDVYKDPENHQTELSCYEILTENGEVDVDPRNIRKLEKTIKTLIELPRHHGTITRSMGTDKYMVIDPRRQQTLFEKVSYTRKGDELIDTTVVIEGFLDKLIVYDNPIGDDIRKFKATFISKQKNYPQKIGPGTISEIYNFLVESGLIESSRYGKDITTVAINTFVRQGLAEVKSEIESPGFYSSPEQDKILAVKFEQEQQTQEQLKQALDLLEEFMQYFPGHERKLITVFKWGLISPFIFAMKQRGADVQLLYLYGRGGSGKTTMGKMVLYMWDKPDENNDIGGSGFNTEYRIGNRLSQSTFPILVNEPGMIFENINTRDMIKTASQQTTSRGKQVNGRYTTILALASVIFTSNQPLPIIGDDLEALIRRFLIQSFGYDEKKTKEEQEAFRQAFDIKNTKNCRLHGLKPFGQFVVDEVVNDPALLDMDWRELADLMVLRICMDIGIDVPEWLKGWSEAETQYDFDDIQIERVRGFLVKQINDAYGRIQVVDEEGKSQSKFDLESDIKTSKSFKNRVWVVLNERTIPWLLLDASNNVHLTYGFIEALQKGTCIKDSMSTIADLLGWRKPQNTKVRSANFKGKSITVSRDEFTSFLFPECESEKCDQ